MSSYRIKMNFNDPTGHEPNTYSITRKAIDFDSLIERLCIEEVGDCTIGTDYSSFSEWWVDYMESVGEEVEMDDAPNFGDSILDWWEGESLYSNIPYIERIIENGKIIYKR